MSNNLPTLPPDPDQMNNQRAAWADGALEAFRDLTRTDPECRLLDLLCDLMHWCDRHDEDFEATLASARGLYRQEISEEA